MYLLIYRIFLKNYVYTCLTLEYIIDVHKMNDWFVCSIR